MFQKNDMSFINVVAIGIGSIVGARPGHFDFPALDLCIFSDCRNCSNVFRLLLCETFG